MYKTLNNVNTLYCEYARVGGYLPNQSQWALCVHHAATCAEHATSYVVNLR